MENQKEEKSAHQLAEEKIWEAIKGWTYSDAKYLLESIERNLGDFSIVEASQTTEKPKVTADIAVEWQKEIKSKFEDILHEYSMRSNNEYQFRIDEGANPNDATFEIELLHVHRRPK